jgi:mannose-1-phosphate guanylyltransferase
MRAMLLTAGLGTRLRPLTNLYAKPAVPFLGIPLARYPLHLLTEAGVKHFVFNSHHKPEQIEDLAKQVQSEGLTVDICHEPNAPLGSGGGIWNARELLAARSSTTVAEDAFFVANGDEVILPKRPGALDRFLEEHRRHSALATILVMHHPLVGSQFGGVWADKTGQVRGFGKNGAPFGKEATAYHYIGLLLLNRRIFDYLPVGESNILYDALALAIAKGERVRILCEDFTWFETGNPRDFLQATGCALELLQSGEGPDAATLRSVTTKHWAPGTNLSRRDGALLLTAPGSVIEDDCQLKGFVVVENGARINRGASVENSVVFSGGAVGRDAFVQNELVFS